MGRGGLQLMGILWGGGWGGQMGQGLRENEKGSAVHFGSSGKKMGKMSMALSKLAEDL